MIVLDIILAAVLIPIGIHIKDTRKVKIEAEPGFNTVIPTIYNICLVFIFAGILFFLLKQIP
jgi:hypothetical protein